MMRNNATRGNTTLSRALEELAARLPKAWSIDVVEQPAGTGAPDVVVRLAAPDGTAATLTVDVKSRFDPKDVEPLTSRLEMRHWGDSDAMPMIVSRFLGERTREKLRAVGAGYVDLTGNIYLRLDAPAVAIERVGATRDPEPAQRPARSLKGAKAGRVVRVLADFRPPLGTREIAEKAQVDPGYVSRLLAMLDREDLVDRERRGPIVRVGWADLLRAWAKDYSLTKSNVTLPCLQPRGLSPLLDSLRELSASAGIRYALSGSLAAARRAPVAPAKLAVVYVDRPDTARQTLGLIPAESGANVLLAEPFDAVVFERTVIDNGLTYVAPSQAVADLLTSPGRGPEEADALIEWMRENEESWRA